MWTLSSYGCLLQVSAYDPDCNGNTQVMYHLANMTQSTMDVFSIGSTSGWLCVAKPLDYERQKIYEFPVYATDSGKAELKMSNIQKAI